MADLVRDLFGEGTNLNPLQMSARAMTVFVITLLMIRVAGRRSFGKHSALDVCIAVLLGAVVSRAVVGASPFVATLCSAAVLVVMHRLVAWVAVRSPRFERVLTGREQVLIDAGEMDPAAMRAALISERDLYEAMRKRFGDDVLDQLGRATLERYGDVSLQRK